MDSVAFYNNTGTVVGINRSGVSVWHVHNAGDTVPVSHSWCTLLADLSLEMSVFSAGHYKWHGVCEIYTVNLA